MIKWRGFSWCLLIVVTIGCTRMCHKDHRDMSPEDVLRSYLEIAFNMESVTQKTDLLQFTTGDLYHAIGSATDEAIVDAYIKPRYKLDDFIIISREDQTPGHCEITYQLKYRQVLPGKKSFDQSSAIETEHTIVLEKVDNYWKINDIIGVKSSIAFPITSESEIKAHPPKKI